MLKCSLQVAVLTHNVVESNIKGNEQANKQTCTKYSANTKYNSCAADLLMIRQHLLPQLRNCYNTYQNEKSQHGEEGGGVIVTA